MSLAGPSPGERLFRLTTAVVSIAPVPWVPMVTAIIKEIYDLIVRIKLVKPQCRQLAEEASRISDELQNHEKLHPGDSKIADLVQLLRLKLIEIRTDLRHWANYNKFMSYYRHRDVLGRIDFHRTSLSELITDLTFKGVLIHDIESAQMQKTVEDMGVSIEKIQLQIDQGSKATETVKEDWRATDMVDIDSIEAAEQRIFALRLDPENFPSADMKGEVVKSRPHYECQGTTFDVFKAAWLTKRWVAAKRFRVIEYDEKDEKSQRRFTRQMNIWRSLKHPNILPVFGICRFEADKPPYLISPWMKYGDVRKYMKQFAGKVDKLKLIYEIALGLQYIHSVGILHGNLNPTNVLVNIDHRVRLTGFSLSKVMHEEASITKTLTVNDCFRWWSPETSLRKVMSEQSDIWSWGMTTLEILSEQYPYKHTTCPFTIRELQSNNKVPLPEDYNPQIATERLWTLMLDCWTPYGTRASLEYIISVLHQEREKTGWNPNAPPPEPNVDTDFPESF
ncbi:hypothetical protein FS837_010899 [Tulasnella sp. UAMH 9824]|nr:hypothetical protein FS837_010899 [Tulasnella sp. UAMH 9824]